MSTDFTERRTVQDPMAGYSTFVNGIPILLVETKAAHKRDALAEALNQVRCYHEQGAPLFALM